MCKAAGDPETVIPSKMFWVFGNHCRFVRPGMVRVAIDGVSQNHAGLLATAYHDAASGRVVVVYVNSSRDPVPVRVEIAGAVTRSGSQRAYVTSGAQGDDLRALDAMAPRTPLTIPARAVVTVVLE